MEVFAVPVDGRYLVYRPLVPLAFVANGALADAALQLAADPGLEVPALARAFLERIGFLRPDPPPPPPLGHEWHPTTAVVLLTNRCNLRCTYCYANAGVATPHDRKGQGFRANVFNHWAGPRDANVYFTFPARSEDLLAVGPIADGVFGDHHYRHPAYAPWMAGDPPALEGGLRRPAAAEREPLVTALLGARLGPGDVRALGAFPDGELLLDRWVRRGLVEEDAVGGLRLTPSGAWFAGTMVRELGALPSSFLPAAG